MNKKIVVYLPIVIILALVTYNYLHHDLAGRAAVVPVPGASASVQPIGSRTKTSTCAARGALPDAACTPGELLTASTKDQICRSGYSKTVRNVPTAVKSQVFKEYGILSHSVGEYEVDHLISLELGGSNAIANLWPEAAIPMPGFHEKDAVENYLHSQVCSGAISLSQAQQEVATNWLQVYQQMH